MIIYIPTKILKLVCKEISVPIAQPVKFYFTSGNFSSILKLSKVVPVFKTGFLFKLEITVQCLFFPIFTIFELILQKRAIRHISFPPFRSSFAPTFNVIKFIQCFI